MSKRESFTHKCILVEHLWNASTIHWEDALAKVSITFKWQGWCSPDDFVHQSCSAPASLNQKPPEWKHHYRQSPIRVETLFSNRQKFPAVCPCPWHTHKMKSSSAQNTRGSHLIVPANSVCGVGLWDGWHMEVWTSNEDVGNYTVIHS